MSFLCFVALVLFTGYSDATSSRIAGGQPTTIEKYPSIAQIELQDNVNGVWLQNCAASILTTRYLLSAAHCVDYRFFPTNWVRFRAGSTYRNVGGVVVYVGRVYLHPNYERFDSDIAVIEMSTPLVYNPVIQPTAIAAQGSVIPANLPVVYAGWGVTEQDSTIFSNVLRDVQVYTINTKLCTERYAELDRRINISESMICAGVLDVGGQGACLGDSGGPLYYGNILIGVFSWSHGCGNDTYPGVSTNVASYTDWIVSIAV